MHYVIGESYIGIKQNRSTYSAINLTREFQSSFLHNHNTGKERSYDRIYSNSLPLNDYNKEVWRLNILSVIKGYLMLPGLSGYRLSSSIRNVAQKNS